MFNKTSLGIVFAVSAAMAVTAVAAKESLGSAEIPGQERAAAASSAVSTEVTPVAHTISPAGPEAAFVMQGADFPGPAALALFGAALVGLGWKSHGRPT